MSGPVVARQGGAVLILMFVALVIAAVSVVVTALSNQDPSLRENIRTREGLQEAKQLLLAYAMTYSDNYSLNPPNGPGRFPCPDTDNDGLMNCGVATLGRLPQQVILPSGSPFELSDTDVGTGQQFWYAVNAAYRQNSAALNSATATSFTFNGNANIVAVLIAPGELLTGQVRASVANRNSAANYLENGNQTGPAFVSNSPLNPTAFNDVVVAISRDEVMSLATVRVAQEFKRVLDLDPFAIDGYPVNLTDFNTAMAGAVAWVSANSWRTTALESYTPVSATIVEIKFNNCNTVFRFEFEVAGMTRTPSTCEG